MGNWDKFLGLAGITNANKSRVVLDALRAEDEVIKNEQLKTIEARQAREYQAIKMLNEKARDAIEQQRQDEHAMYEEKLEEYKEQVDEEYMEEVREAVKDEETVNMIKNSNKGTQEWRDNLAAIYESDQAIPLRAMFAVYPPGRKRVFNESGWDKFVNAVKEGWHKFVKWFKSVGWKILVEIGVSVILAFVPGIGTMLAMAVETGMSIALDIIDTAKTSAERVALQRAMNEGKSRGLDEYEEMYMWRSLMIIFITAMADAMDMTIDGRQLSILMRTDGDFMNRVKDNEFVKNMWACQSKLVETMTGEDPATNEPDYEYTLDDVKECRDTALELLSDARLRGLVQGLPKNLKTIKKLIS